MINNGLLYYGKPLATSAQRRILGKLKRNQHKRRSHEDKIPHPNEETANKAAVEMTRFSGEPFDAYKCVHCPYWHIGHSKFVKYR